MAISLRRIIPHTEPVVVTGGEPLMLEPFERRSTVVVDPALLDRCRGAVLPDGSTGCVVQPDGQGMRRRGSSAVDVTNHPNADEAAHAPVRPRAQATQGGNGVK